MAAALETFINHGVEIRHGAMVEMISLISSAKLFILTLLLRIDS